MKVIKKENMKVILSDVGYILHNTKDDTFSRQVYMPINTSLDIYEEVVDNTVSENLRLTFEEIKQKEESLHKIGKIVANNVTDDIQALDIQEFYDDWEVGVKYEVGTYIRYEGVLYKVITAHTSQSDWTPTSASSLFAKVLTDPTGETINEWVQPDSTNAYMTGDKVIFEGKTYESIIDNNVWSPSAYPAGWKEI